MQNSIDIKSYHLNKETAYSELQSLRACNKKVFNKYYVLPYLNI